MGISARLLRLARPQRFLYTMSLSTGASLITLSLLINKLSGLYGILALLTGYHLSAFQLSMYIYSIIALALAVYLAPHIRKQSPLHCLALAWFYVLDSVINAAFTAAFAVSWFLVLAQHNAGEANKKGPGAATIDDTAGFTNPQFNVSRVEVVATPKGGLTGGQDAVAAGVASNTAAGAGGNGALQQAVLSTESMNSIGIIVVMWTVRAYFCLIMLAFARMVIRQYIASQSKSQTFASASADSNLAENPFGESKPKGQGWPGKLGRVMLSIGRTYWLGSDEDDSWMYGMRFRAQAESEGVALNKIENGTAERERRRRSGTGPPLPSANLTGKDAGDGTLQVPAQNL